MVGAKPRQACIDLGHDRLPRKASGIRVSPRREEDLGRDHHLVPPGEVAEGTACDLFTGPVGIGVGRVEEEVDAAIKEHAG